MSRCKISTCFECGAAATHRHHVIPQVFGGKNTVPLCDICHSLIHDRSFLHHRKLVKKGLDNRRKKGLTTGPAPFGYKTEGEVYVEDPAMFPALAHIHELRSQGLSIRKIAEALNESGLYPQKIHKTTVERVLTKTAKAQDEQPA